MGACLRFPSPADLKRRRMELGLTQKELAKLAGVSQPLIARIESGDIDPRLSTIKKIFDALESVEFKRPKIIARDVMTSPVITVAPDDTIEKAVEIMAKHALSQLPVVEKGIPIGSISEGTIVRYSLTSDFKDFNKISSMRVKEIMEESFPTVAPTTDLSIVSHLLESNHAVLVVEKGEVLGVITKHDIMKLVQR
ncbi:MAG: CBS domain-containing protein [Methanocellales archaeon]